MKGGRKTLNEFPDQRTIARLKSIFPTDTRVVLEKIEDPYTQLKPGDGGKVIHVDDAEGIHF